MFKVNEVVQVSNDENFEEYKAAWFLSDVSKSIKYDKDFLPKYLVVLLEDFNIHGYNYARKPNKKELTLEDRVRILEDRLNKEE